MTRLTVEQILKEKNTSNPNSVTSLVLNWKALSDVSCLGEFKNLEKLDLGSNDLKSLEGLRLCVNLKWLSVVQNNLQTLSGIEGLSKLTVLNAGKNKLKSMEEIKSLSSLRALILNDNEIVSLCKLDRMKELSTLVLSKNPIRKIGDSLANVKSIRKVSLSHCQLEVIDSCFKSCIELKELRLAHNDIKAIPLDLEHNRKLRNLDLGNNLISRLSNCKVLNSLVNLRNINLQGNPIAEKDKLVKEVQKSLPNLHVFNAKPLNKLNNTDRDKNEHQSKVKNKDAEADADADKQLKQKKRKAEDKTLNKLVIEDTYKQKLKRCDDKHSVDNDSEKKVKRESKAKNATILRKEVEGKEDDKVGKKRKKRQAEVDIIDDGEAHFTELFASTAADNDESRIAGKVAQGVEVMHSAKKKKGKNSGLRPELDLNQEYEIGIGGASTWSD